MADLTLLVNSTDTALLNGGAVTPVGAGDTAVGASTPGGFASVLGGRLALAEGAAVTESPPPAANAVPATVTESGDAQPLDGNALPSAALPDASQDVQTDLASDLPSNDPLLAASLLSAVAQASTTANGQPAPLLADTSLASTPASALVSPEAGLTPAMATLAGSQLPNENGVAAQAVKNAELPAALVNPQTNPQAATITAQTTSQTLPDAAQNAQQANSSAGIPAMLGKPISSAAHQALVRAGLNASKSHGLRDGSMSSAMSAALSEQRNLSATAVGVNQSAATTMRMDLFQAAMNAATQTKSHAEPHLPAHTTTALSATPLATAGEMLGDAVNATAAASRLPGSASSPLAPTLPLSTPVGQSPWASELGQRVTWLANNELREAQLQLHPRSLGAVEVRIAYGHEHQLNISFSAANPVARDALDASLPRLREMLEQQGLQLGDANISHESPAEREQHQEMNPESMFTNKVQTLDGLPGEVMPGEVLTPQWAGEGMLDAYA
jgi:flagellar hook-length control protein FliK